MAISVTNIGVNANTTGATVAITVPAGGVPVGALICLTSSESTNSFPPGSVADTASNTYAEVISARRSDGPTGFGSIFYAWNVAALVSGNTITYTKVASGARTAISAFYATGILTISDPLDSAATASAFGTGVSPSVTSGTPSVAGDLFVAAVIFGGNHSFTQDTGHGWATPFNESASGATSTDACVDGGNQINPGTGTKIYAPTINNIDWAALICAFKAAANNQPPYQPWAQRGPMLAS